MIFRTFAAGAANGRAAEFLGGASGGTQRQPEDVASAPGAVARLCNLVRSSSSKLLLGRQQQQQQLQQLQQPSQREPSPEPPGEPEPNWQLQRKYTLSEVQQHGSLEDCWMVIFDKVYDITQFVYEHPGGDFILLEYAGRDATHPFLSSRHGSSAYKMLDKYWIGILVDEELYYSNNSSYCSVYSNLSWRSSPAAAPASPPEVGEASDATLDADQLMAPMVVVAAAAAAASAAPNHQGPIAPEVEIAQQQQQQQQPVWPGTQQTADLSDVEADSEDADDHQHDLHAHQHNQPCDPARPEVAAGFAQLVALARRPAAVRRLRGYPAVLLSSSPGNSSRGSLSASPSNSDDDEQLPADELDLGRRHRCRTCSSKQPRRGASSRFR